MNESRGKLLWMCAEAYDASEFIMGENDEKKKNTLLYTLPVWARRVGAPFLSGLANSLLFCVRGVGLSGFSLGCVSVSKIDTFLNNSFVYLFLILPRSSSPCIHA